MNDWRAEHLRGYKAFMSDSQRPLPIVRSVQSGMISSPVTRRCSSRCLRSGPNSAAAILLTRA